MVGLQAEKPVEELEGLFGVPQVDGRQCTPVEGLHVFPVPLEDCVEVLRGLAVSSHVEEEFSPPHEGTQVARGHFDRVVEVVQGLFVLAKSGMGQTPVHVDEGAPAFGQFGGFERAGIGFHGRGVPGVPLTGQRGEEELAPHPYIPHVRVPTGLEDGLGPADGQGRVRVQRPEEGVDRGEGVVPGVGHEAVVEGFQRVGLPRGVGQFLPLFEAQAVPLFFVVLGQRGVQVFPLLGGLASLVAEHLGPDEIVVHPSHRGFLDEGELGEPGEEGFVRVGDEDAEDVPVEPTGKGGVDCDAPLGGVGDPLEEVVDGRVAGVVQFGQVVRAFGDEHGHEEGEVPRHPFDGFDQGGILDAVMPEVGA